MLTRLISWSARNPFLVLLATLCVVMAGAYAIARTPVDALPDLSDTQVIVYTEYPGQAPQVVEDQVTYPLTTALLSVPKSKVVRGFSFFGVSFVYVIFEDGTDVYWARSRVLEYLNQASDRLPRGVTPVLGPDASGVGWVYQYALLAKNRTLAELRSIQDWYLRYQIGSVEGVAEVASLGGFVRQYQINLDPNKLAAYRLPIKNVVAAIRMSNNDVGGRVLERGGDMVVAAHRTPLGRRLVATTVESVRFDRPATVDFRVLRGPVPHVVERFTLHDTDGMEETDALMYEEPYGTAVFATDDAKEGPRAFAEKRKPVFKGQ